MRPQAANRVPQITCVVLLSLLSGRLAHGAEGEGPPTLPDVRAVAREREKAVVRVETFESYVPGLVRRGCRLLNPFPLTSNVSDAVSFAFYLPSGIFYGMRKHLGSGVIFDREGYILTNHHVVKQADRVTVRLTDAKGVRRRFDGKVVGTDPHTDIALVKIEPGDTPLVAAPLGDSDALALGDWVIAIGHPMRLTGTVTCGIVSGLHRQLRANLIEDYIQVDAALNPGNSGGPILNTRGEVVAIVDLGMFPANNLGFAIPTSLIAPFLDQLKEKGRVSRGYLGVNVRDLSPELAKEWALDAEAGVVVAEVTYASPGGRAGLREGDIIESVAGKKVETARDVQAAVLRTPPEAELAITVRRGDKTLELKATLGKRRAPFRVF